MQGFEFLSPASLFRAARKANPAFKYVIGVAGILALVVSITRYGVSFATLVFGSIGIFALMILFLLFSQAAVIAKTSLTRPALVLVWSFLVLCIVVATLLGTSTFFNQPLPFRSYLIRQLHLEPTEPHSNVKDSNPRPHLALCVVGKPNLWLTNDSFVAKGSYHTTNFTMLLVVPVDPPRLPPVLTFAVKNEQIGTEARSTQIIFTHDKALTVMEDVAHDSELHWNDGFVEGNEGEKCAMLLFRFPLPASDSFGLPPFFFPNVESNLDKPFFNCFSLKSTDTPTTELAFWMVFIRTTNFTSPRLIKMQPDSRILGSNGIEMEFELD